MPGRLTFLSSISSWCVQVFCSPNILPVQTVLWKNKFVQPNYPVVLCWCHYMELFYLLYLNGFISTLLSWQSSTLDSYDEKSTLYRPFHIFLKTWWKMHHQCFICIVCCKYQHAHKDRKVTTKGHKAHVQPVLPFTMAFLYILTLFLAFCGVFFICSICSSFHHGFSSYTQPFLVFFARFFFIGSTFLPFIMAFLRIFTFFLAFCWVFLHMFNLFFLSPWLFFIYSAFSWLFAGFFFIGSTFSSFHHVFLRIFKFFSTFCLVLANFQVCFKMILSSKAISI